MLTLDEFVKHVLPKEMTSNTTGGVCTGGGFRLIGTSNPKCGRYINFYSAWDADDSNGCGGLTYTNLRTEVGPEYGDGCA